jgi:hypothetical protein
MEWKAIIDSKSKVDSAGRIDVIFNIFVDDALEYHSIQINCPAIEMNEVIRQKMADIKNNFEAAQQINEGSEILL